MRALSLLCAVALSLALLACGTPAPPVYPALAADPPRHAGFSAAARVVDITPPVHLALFGHGPESRVSTGVRLRLRCEVILVASRGEVVALVPCDLQSSSEALQRAVADKLRALGVPIAADRLFIMATHTHMAPAHYFEARRYSGVFSSILSGFDPMVVDHLATRISDGVRLAYLELAPACVAWQQASIADAQLQLNRAFVPYLSNQALYSGPSPEAVDSGFPRTIQRSQAADAPAKNLLGAELAVDSRLSLLRVDRRASGELVCAGATPMAALAVFGMHPTGLPNTNSLYHGDIFGYAMRAAEGKLTRKYFADGIARAASWDEDGSPPGQPENRRVIVGLANGSDGDVSPRIYEQSEMETRRVGRILGGRIATLFESALSLSPDGKVDRLYRELNFSAARYGDSESELLCEYGELGTVTGGGARDGPTRLRVIPQTNQGFIPDVEDPCHRAKMPLRNGAPGEYDYPRFGAIGLVRIGDGVIATAPGEMTTMTNLRIRRALTAALPQKTLAVVGLTNQYFQYFTTAEEYPFQYYEGASTLYGPNTERFLSRHFGYLGMLLGQRWDPPLEKPHGPVVPQNDLPDQRGVNELRPFDRCHASPVVRRWPDDVAPVLTPKEELAVVPRFRYGAWGYEFELGVLSPLSTTTLASEKVPDLPGCNQPFAATKNPKPGYRPLVVQVLEGGAVVDDDMGPNLELQELDSEKWRVRWMPSIELGDPRCGRRYSIKASLVTSPGASPVVIEPPPFAVECRPPMPSGRAP